LQYFFPFGPRVRLRLKNVNTELKFHTSEIRQCYRYKHYILVNTVPNYTKITLQ